MKFEDANNKIPIEEAKKSIKSFIDGFEGDDNKFSLVIFSDKQKVLCEPTSDKKVIKDAVDRIKLKDTGSGTTATPIDLARATASIDGYLEVIVILTDGIWKRMDVSIAQSRECRKDGVPIFALGFGDANKGFLKQIATVDNGGLYTTIEKLGSTFDTIATAIKTDNMGIRDKD
jgi:molecular chaperone DnaK